jgi:hypothetical protein
VRDGDGPRCTGVGGDVGSGSSVGGVGSGSGGDRVERVPLALARRLRSLLLGEQLRSAGDALRVECRVKAAEALREQRQR